MFKKQNNISQENRGHFTRKVIFLPFCAFYSVLHQITLTLRIILSFKFNEPKIEDNNVEKQIASKLKKLSPKIRKEKLKNAVFANWLFLFFLAFFLFVMTHFISFHVNLSILWFIFYSIVLIIILFWMLYSAYQVYVLKNMLAIKFQRFLKLMLKKPYLLLTTFIP